jgi:hypothetical protein
LETPWEDIKKGMILDVIRFTRALLSSLAYKTPPFGSTCLDKILFFPSRVSSASMLYLITKMLVRQRNSFGNAVETTFSQNLNFFFLL